jgi:hypothetical protein
VPQIIVDTAGRGETLMRQQMERYFSQYIPVYLQTLIDQNQDMDALKSPMPIMYNASDPLDTPDGMYPVIGAFFNGSTDYRVIDLTPSGGFVYNPTYEVTLFVAVVTAQIGANDAGPTWDSPTRDTTVRQRDDLINALVAAIINSPSLGTANTETPMMVDLENMRKATPEPMKLQGQTNSRWVDTGLITINVSRVETTAVPILGYFNEYNQDIDKMV